MRIEELVLEGFKSYPVRTTITGWDASFNAITGLNGSGKSNILDAICFVLGMTNVSQMRAQNQQDLIYKRGQAGITKASVTIVFDNSDPTTSPVGLENCRQITVTRQIALPNVSKYLLNGHKSQQHTIQTLFQSVQLNINNPTFLIMQGKITKVLNMRPAEILGMVEEAAGTRMFEERKDKAARTMAKKDKKVQEYAGLLADEITPKLDKTREEKRMFVRYQKATSELERAARVLRAHEHWDGTRRAAEKAREAREKQQQAEELVASKGELEQGIKAAEKEMKKIETQRDKELQKGGAFQKLERQVAELDKVVVKLRTQADIKKDTIKSEKEKLGKLAQERNGLEEQLEAKRQESTRLTSVLDKVKREHTDTSTNLTKSEELLQALLTGLGGTNTAAGSGGGYMGQLADAQKALETARADEAQTRVKLELAKKELAEQEKRAKALEREAGEGRAALERMRREVEALRARAEKSGWSEEKEREAGEAMKTAKDQERRAGQDLDSVRARMPNLAFDYTSPRPDFDPRSVKGLVATLVSLDAKHHHAATALEITAGGKLYNVVVQDERVGKELLERGRLKKRVTIIPLNKISGSRWTPDKVAAALGKAPGQADLALDLVGYADDVARAMAFVFGDTAVCADAAAARDVTFKGGMRAVTLAGDVYDPSGTLSGGAAPSSAGVLLRVQEVVGAQRVADEARARVEGLRREEEAGRGRRGAWREAVKGLDMKMHEERLLTAQVEGSNATKVQAEIDKLKATIAELNEALEDAQARQKAVQAEAKKLEKDMAEFKNNKNGKIDELKKEITEQKSALQKHNVVLKTHQKDAQTALLELEGLENELSGHDDTVREAGDLIKEAEDDLSELSSMLKKQEDAHHAATTALQKERAQLSHYDDQLKQLESVLAQKKQEISAGEIAVGALRAAAATLTKEREALTKFVGNLEKQFEWIAEEKERFGEAGTQFDFDSLDIEQVREHTGALEVETKALKKKVNPRAAARLESQEKHELAVKKNMATVLKDREKIEDTIAELDRYKRDALVKTWEKVSADFGGIFAELLPGNFAKLQAPEGQDITQGLEVKVQLGSVWKQSLTELSGGQRSLIALSLIMSLLQFKPAPMYILDEIDAALDLSHTQHIGQLFRTRFRGSQFIVVSLKEGLFTNANVLFRTRFRDGTSVVERTAHRSASSLYERA